MREIKFRAWDKDDKIMWENVIIADGQACLSEGDIDFTDGDVGFSARLINNYELMQYTGLKDKNSKEIYEGDIVKLYSNVGRIIFIKGQYRIDPNIEIMNNIYHAVSLGLEVIGNIYENGELLEKD